MVQESAIISVCCLISPRGAVSTLVVVHAGPQTYKRVWGNIGDGDVTYRPRFLPYYAKQDSAVALVCKRGRHKKG